MRQPSTKRLAADTLVGLGCAGWSESTIAGMTVWTAAALRPYPHLRHVFTSADVNMSTRTGPDPDIDYKHRHALIRALGADASRLAAPRQVHGVAVFTVSPTHRDGHSADELAACDATITAATGVPLMAMSADCPIILLYSPNRDHEGAASALGLAHSGWRGTVDGMPRQVCREILQHTGGDARDLMAIVSPCAGGCCYEIRDDVLERVARATPNVDRHVARRDGRMYLNLPSLIAEQLINEGLSPARIHLPEQCTICDTRFHSYRRQGAQTGHAAMLACITPTRE